MNIKWIEFTPLPKKPVILPMRASINRSGRLTLNYAAFRAIGQSEAVKLLFDPSNLLIGLKPVYPSTPGARHVKRRKNRNFSFYVCAKEFCNYFGISLKRVVKFQHIEATDDGTLILALFPGTKFFINPAER